MNRKTLKQLEFAGVNGWGGRRPGSGRKNLSRQVNHMKRPKVSLKVPLHVTLRLKERLPTLRKKSLFAEFKESLKGARNQGLNVIHFSIQSNHIHLFCESANNRSLSLGMRALAGRFAKILRKYFFSKGGERSGSVFEGRYHLHLLKTPAEVRNALEYILLNLSKHQKLIEYIDDFSSGQCFKEWRTLLGKRFKSLVRSDGAFWEKHDPGDLIEILSPPQSWLARVGWIRACGSRLT